jgi:hypothetical protein
LHTDKNNSGFLGILQKEYALPIGWHSRFLTDYTPRAELGGFLNPLTVEEILICFYFRTIRLFVCSALVSKPAIII